MICPKCSSEVREGAQFCSNCGARAVGVRETLVESVATAEAGARSGGGAKTVVSSGALAGQVLDGKYELVEQLGAGGMGSVYRARRVHIGDEVAVKILHPAYIADESAVERFRREARAAAQLHHANVVTIHDYGETSAGGGPLAYIVMELVAGISLRELLKDEGRLEPRRAAALMRVVCAGVGAAHRRGIVHRDIKPDNIIVLAPDDDREGESVKVVDFGIAKLRDAANESTLTIAGAVIGTPYYMSPEQCLGEKLDARADVYSLGALLYEMLAGTPPFTAPTATGVIAKHLSEPPPPVPVDVPVAPALAAAIQRALSKDPNARQADASEFARELLAAETNTAAPPHEARASGHPSQVVPVPPRPPERQGPPDPAPPAGPPPHHAGAGHARHAPQHPAPAPRKSRTALVVGLLAVFAVLIAGAGFGAYLFLSSGGNNRERASANRRTNQNVNANANTNAQANTNANTQPTPGGAFQRAEAKVLSAAALKSEDLAGLTPAELALLRNVVYARHGRPFTSPLVNAYLKGRPWYRPRADYSDDMLTDKDAANVKLIRAAEGAGDVPDPKTARKEIERSLDDWADSTGGHDLDAHMNHYADTLETYYNQRAVARDRVRAERGRAFERYHSMEVDLSNVRVVLDETGTAATVVLDKTWRFDGEKCSQGKVQQQLRLARAGRRWVITGERDLKVYPDADDDCD